MSIATEITRIMEAKASVGQAIRDKGITVADSMPLVAYASLIRNIKTIPDGISALDFGTIRITSAFTTTRQTFTHKLGVVPDLMIVWTPTNITTTYTMLCAIRGSVFNWRGSSYDNHMAYHPNNSTSTVTWTNSNSTTYGISNMTATSFQLASSGNQYYWRAGIYNYIAIKFN